MTDEKLIVAQREMRPAFFVANLAFTNDRELFRIGIEQVENPLLIQSQNLFTIGNHAPILAERSAGPCVVASLEIQASNALVPQM